MTSLLGEFNVVMSILGKFVSSARFTKFAETQLVKLMSPQFGIHDTQFEVCISTVGYKVVSFVGV